MHMGNEVNQLRLFESLDRVNRAMQRASDLDKMMSNVLDEILDIFDCDRASLVYPCDPDATSWSVPMERTKPEYPGVYALGREMPMTPEVAAMHRTSLSSKHPLPFGNGTDFPISPEIQAHGDKSGIGMALFPKSGKPWGFSIIQCSRERQWSQEEQRLFEEIGHRLSDSLTSLLIMHDLKESEEKYRRFVETSTEGVWALDENCLTSFINLRMAEMLGYSAGELIGHPLSDFMFEEDIADHEKHMQLRRKGISEHYNRRFRCKDGSELWTRVSASVIKGDKGEFQGSFAMLNDITERMLMDDALVFIAQHGWKDDAENFFDALVKFLGKKFNVDYVVIDKLGENPDFAETVALYAKGAIVPNINYPLKNTPCENVMGKKLCFYPHGAQQRFPKDRLLVEMGVESYIGIPLWDSFEQPIGLIALMDSKPFSEDTSATQVLQLVATRVSAELQREQSELRLHERELQFRSLAENTPDNIIRYDQQCRTTYFNPGMIRTLGIKPERLLGKTPVELGFGGPELSAEFEEHIRQVLKSGKSNDIEIVIPDPEGSLRTHLVRFSAERDAEGKVVSVLAIGRDITERKRAEEALRSKHDQLSSIYATSPVGITMLDRNGHIINANPQAEKVLGLKKSDILQLQYNTPAWSISNPDGSPFPDDQLPFPRVKATGKPVRDVQHAIQWPDGQRVLLSVNAAPLFDQSGQFDGMIASIEDITERKLAEEAIREKQKQLLEAQRIGKIGNWWHNTVTGEMYWSEEFFNILGIQPQKPSVELGFALIHPDDRHLLQGDMELSANKNGEFEQEFRIIRPDGETRWVHNRWIRITDKSGKEIKRVGTHQDITERKQAEMELYRLNRELRAISDCNLALMKATDEQVLLNEVCNIICEETGYMLAWVGYAENDEAKTIRPVAWAGEGSDYIAKAKLSWSDEVEHGRGPAGEVIRSGETIYVQDFENSELMTPWRQSALAHGYRSGIALPLKNEEGQTFGTLLIYSGEKGAINPDEIRLMEELAGDLAYGIVNLRVRNDNRRATEALAASEKLQRLLLDTLTQQVFYKDCDSRYIACNRTFAQGLGMEPEEIVGKSDFEIYPRELAERYRGDDLATMESGKTIEVEEPYEAGGKKFWVHTVKTPMRDATGEVTGVLGIFWDITEQKRASEKLERSESKLAEAQHLAKLGNWELNLVTNKLEWSDEVYEIFEIDKEKFGASYEAFLNAIHPDDRDMVNKAYTDSVNNHSGYETSHRLLMEDGRIKYVQEQGHTDYDKDGKPLRSVGTVQDISHLHEMEEQLHQAQKMEAIGTLVGGIAHDFNNKLAAITGNLYLAQRNIDPQSEIANRLNSVETLSFEAASMVQQLLTFARKGTVQMAPLSLVSFIKETAKLNRVAIPEDIHFSIRPGDDPLPIMGDITQLQQLFLNLLTNARHALEGVEKPRIEVSLQLYEPETEFREHHPEVTDFPLFALMKVCDNGHGIAPEHLNQIFDPFFTTKKVGEGTGLGLAMVYGVVQSHHGIIAVDSTPGEGTCFSIYLPIHRDAEIQNSADKEVKAATGQGETILLADDDTSVLESFSDVLTSIHYHVLTAHNGQEAVDLFRQHADTIDLVILDIVMPEMKGPRVAELIREINPDAKILFATGYDSPKGDEKIMDSSDILGKPFAVEQVSKIIRQKLSH